MVGVAVPELVRDPESDAVEANKVEREGFDLLYGKSPSDEAGDARCFGRVMEPSASGYWGGLNGVASCSGVMRGSGSEPWWFEKGAQSLGISSWISSG